MVSTSQLKLTKFFLWGYFCCSFSFFKAEESALNPIREAVARGQWSLFCFNHFVPDTVHRSCLAGGGCPCGLIYSMSLLTSQGSLHVAGALMAFKCLTHAHTILVGLVLSWKEDKRETLTRSGSSYWGTVSSGAFGTYQRVTLGQSSSVASMAFACWQRVPMRKEKRGGGGRDPRVPVRATKNVMVRAWVGKEFPDMRQNEREIKFIRAGDAVRTVGQPKGEPTMLLLLLSLDSIVVVQLLSCVQLFVTSWTIACQVSLSLTISWILLKLVSVELVILSNHLILCCLLLPSFFPSIRVFSSESAALHIKWPKCWSFSIISSNKYSGLISFRIDWFDLLAVQGPLKSLLQHHSS